MLYSHSSWPSLERHRQQVRLPSDRSEKRTWISRPAVGTSIVPWHHLNQFLESLFIAHLGALAHSRRHAVRSALAGEVGEVFVGKKRLTEPLQEKARLNFLADDHLTLGKRVDEGRCLKRIQCKGRLSTIKEI